MGQGISAKSHRPKGPRKPSGRANLVPVEELSTGARLAFSYARVSTTDQAKGDRDGLDRQQQAFDRFVERHGLTPADEHLIDIGRSAFHGRHRKRGGALGRFVEAARRGEIPAGSVLVVEDLDRFSREAASLQQELLLRLFEADLALGIVRDSRIVDRATYDGDLGLRVMLTVRQDAANDYSRKLSERIESVWERRRDAAAEGRLYRAVRPFWCSWDEPSQTFAFNDHAATVRRLIELSRQGLGCTKIAQTVNAEGLLTSTGRSFAFTYVNRILRDRRLIGELTWKTGEVIPNAYPPLLTQAEFDALQAGITQRSRKRRGRITTVRNLFQGVLFCRCGGQLSWVGGRSRKGAPLYSYLHCIRHRSGACPEQFTTRYDEEWLLRRMMFGRWGQLFRGPDRRKERGQLRQQIAAAEAEHRANLVKVENAERTLRELLGAGELSAADVRMIREQQQALAVEASAAADALALLRGRLAQLGAAGDPAGRARALKANVERFMAGDRDDLTTRTAFNSWLQTLGIRMLLLRGHDSAVPLLVVSQDVPDLEDAIDPATDPAGAWLAFERGERVKPAVFFHPSGLTVEMGGIETDEIEEDVSGKTLFGERTRPVQLEQDEPVMGVTWVNKVWRDDGQDDVDDGRDGDDRR